MKSICKFELKSEYEDYQNEVDILAHVIEENKVYLRLGRQFSFCIHGYFNVPSNNSVIKILGDNVVLDNFAALKFTNLDTGEVKSESSSINRTATLTQGNWKIDYGLYKRDTGFYVAPASMFDNGITVNYIQVDPIVTQVSAQFIRYCPQLTGAMFGELDQYPEVEVFDQPYSRNDVILQNIAFTNNDSTNFLGGNGGCPLVRNVYVGDTVTGFVGCFGHVDANGKTFDSSIKSQVYIGKLVQLPSTDLGSDYLNFINQNKITEFIVSPENPNFIYDNTVQALIRKDTSDGKIIAAGVGTFNNDMLQIPAGYRMRNYRCYQGRAPIIVDLSEFDDHNHTLKNKLMGIRDLNKAELVILPKNLKTIEIYHGAGLSNCESLIVPTKVAPICQWGNDGNLGDRTSAYKGAFSTQTNMTGNGLGHLADKTKRKLYVIEGTAEEKATWTNKYDNWPNPPANTWQNGTTGNWERPNLWYDLTLSYDDGDFKSLWNAASGPYQEFEIIFVPENQMDALIQTKIQEKLTEIQNRNN